MEHGRNQQVMVEDRQRLRGTFDSAADLYDDVRPRYPEELFDALIEAAGLRAGARLLEVGWAGDPFFEEIQEVYDAIGAGEPDGVAGPRPGDLPHEDADIGASGLFRLVLVREFDWEVGYDAEQYLRLLDTFSNHVAMESWQRARLHGEIRARLGRRQDGMLRRGWGAVLQVAQRIDDPWSPGSPTGGGRPTGSGAPPRG